MTNPTDAQPRDRLPATVWVIAGGLLLVLVAVVDRYGIHRDEFYFLAAGKRLAWGYVDQPPLVPFIARLIDGLPGEVGARSLRFLPALSACGVVVTSALLCRRFGGGKTAIATAAAFTAVGGFFLGVGHLLSTATFDILAWCVVLVLVAALIDGADPRLWLAVGAVVGIGLLNKFTILALVGGLLVALLATSQRRVLFTPWLLAGAGVALVISSPTLIWQAANGWPQLDMARSISGRDGPADYILIQLAILSFFLTIPAVTGWRWLMFDRVGRTWRAFPIAWTLLFVAFLFTGGKGYYVAALYVPLLAAGAIWATRLRSPIRRLVITLVAIGAVAGAFLALPLVPPESAAIPNEVNGELGETYGWETFVDQVAAVYDELTPTERDDTTIFTSNYGQAGAIETLGKGRLPQPVSGHNSYWLWGPGSHTGPIIGVGAVGSDLTPICPDLEQVGTITNPAGLENDEYGTSLWLCHDPVASLADIWDDVRHLD